MYSDLSLTVPFLSRVGLLGINVGVSFLSQCWWREGEGSGEGGGGVRDARQTKNNGGPTMEVCNKMVPRVYDDDFNDDVGKEEG